MSDELKELLTHLRASHFSVLGAVFVILVVTTLGTDAKLQRASDQSSIISGFNSVFAGQTMSTAFEKILPGTAGGLSIHEERGNIAWKVESIYHKIREAEVPPPRPKFWIPSGTKAYSPPHSFPLSASKQPSTRTLRDFKELWAFLLNASRGFVVSAFHPEGTVFINDENFSTGSASYSEAIVSITTGSSFNITPNRDFLVQVSMTLLNPPSGYAADYALVGGQIDDPHNRYGRHALIPVEIQAVPINVMPVLLGDAAGLSSEQRINYNRSFDEVFAELSNISTGLESLTIEELRSYLRSQIEKKGPDVELLGAKIPQESIVYWALPALFVLQAYFFINITQLLRGHKNDLCQVDFPWIALYKTKVSDISTYLTIVIVPVTAGGILVKNWPYIEAGVLKIILTCGFFAVLVVSVLSIWGLFRLSTALREIPSNEAGIRR